MSKPSSSWRKYELGRDYCDIDSFAFLFIFLVWLICRRTQLVEGEVVRKHGNFEELYAAERTPHRGRSQHHLPLE